MSDRKVEIRKTGDLKVKNPKVLKSHDLILDKLKNRKIRLYLYKGQPLASRELTETDNQGKKLRLIRLRIDFMQIKDKVNVADLAIKDNIETVDIDLRYLEIFLKRYFDEWQLRRLLTPIVEKHDALPIGALVGKLVLDYGQYIQLVKFLEFMLQEPIKNDKCL